MGGRNRSFCLLFLAIAATWVTATIPLAHAQGETRVVTKNIFTGALAKSPAMDFNEAMARGIAIATGPQRVSCWLEKERRVWFVRLPPRHIALVQARRMTETPRPLHHK